MAFWSFSPGATTVKVASALTFEPAGSTEVDPSSVAMTVPPVGEPSIVLRGEAVSFSDALGCRPVRLPGWVVAFSSTHLPDSQPFLAASTRPCLTR